MAKFRKRKHSWLEDMFKKSDEEVRLEQEWHDEADRFENTLEYKAHRAKLDAIFEKMKNLRKARHQKNYEERTAEMEKPLPDKFTVPFEKKEKEREEDSEELKAAVAAFNALSRRDAIYFNLYTRSEYETMENPPITKEQVDELHHVLVQTCIDFLNAKGLKGIDAVHFSADGLEGSAAFGEWTSQTDSYIEFMGFDKDGKYKTIAKQM